MVAEHPSTVCVPCHLTTPPGLSRRWTWMSFGGWCALVVFVHMPCCQSLLQSGPVVRGITLLATLCLLLAPPPPPPKPLSPSRQCLLLCSPLAPPPSSPCRPPSTTPPRWTWSSSSGSSPTPRPAPWWPSCHGSLTRSTAPWQV
jgi:hypothetical protein